MSAVPEPLAEVVRFPQERADVSAFGVEFVHAAAVWAVSRLSPRDRALFVAALDRGDLAFFRDWRKSS